MKRQKGAEVHVILLFRCVTPHSETYSLVVVFVDNFECVIRYGVCVSLCACVNVNATECAGGVSVDTYVSVCARVSVDVGVSATAYVSATTTKRQQQQQQQ